MDGFALALSDCEQATPAAPIDLAVGHPVQAGDGVGRLPPMAALPISTGAPVPLGADAVIIHEKAVVRGARLRVECPPRALDNIRRIGEDVTVGQTVVKSGERMGPDAVGALLGYGVDTVLVQRLPRLHLFATGNELSPDAAGLSGPGTIVDSNSPMIAAFAQSLGLCAELGGRMPDTPEAVDAMLDRAVRSPCDIIVTTGGVSGGAFDLVRAGLMNLGITPHFHGVRMRPGKPILFATLPDGRPFFGLPGNPVAALVGMRFFVLAALRCLAGLPPEVGQQVRAEQQGRADTTVFLRAKAVWEGDAIVSLDTQLDQRSHILSSVLAANAWLRVDQSGGRTECWGFPKQPTPL
jgi:molybdopterin molybdotransferase